MLPNSKAVRRQSIYFAFHWHERCTVWPSSWCGNSQHGKEITEWFSCKPVVYLKVDGLRSVTGSRSGFVHPSSSLSFLYHGLVFAHIQFLHITHSGFVTTTPAFQCQILHTHTRRGLTLTITLPIKIKWIWNKSERSGNKKWPDLRETKVISLLRHPPPHPTPAKTSRWWVTTSASLFGNTHIVWYNSERGRFLPFIFHRKLTTKQTVYYYFQKLPIFVLTFF